METIIQQIAEKLIKKIIEKAYSGGINDIDALTCAVLQDCKTAAAEIIETICAQINVTIREDKAGRKELGLVIKEKERPRELLSELGKLNLARDYYHDKHRNQYVSLLDHVIGIRPYERIGDTLSARMVSLATDVSYAKSEEIAGGGAISRQTVKNRINKISSLEKHPERKGKKEVKELHIYADEDHVHMQKPNKEKGKSNKIVPLVTVTEGMRLECGMRRRTVGAMHFVDEKFDTKNLWKSVEGYIEQAYDLMNIERIYVHGDGGRWIRNGLEHFPQTVHVMDGYHLGKRIRELCRRFPKKNAGQRIRQAIKGNDRKRANKILQSLYEEADSQMQMKSISEFGKYLMGNWEEIVNRGTLDIPGSCTEAQVSHILSERFSRDPLGWSEKGLGKLTKLRVYEKNGGNISAEDFKKTQEDTYSEYADKVIEEVMSEAMDWSLFNRESFIFNGASGTQTIIRGIGSIKNTLWS